MDERDTRLIPGTKREGRAKERAAETDSSRATDRETAAQRKRSARDRKLKAGGQRREGERKTGG